MERLAAKKQRPGYSRALIFKLRSGAGDAQTMTEPFQSTSPDHDPQEDPLRFPSASTANTWSPTDRWAWACALPVPGVARAVAGCIARHANNLTGLAWPGLARISEETGFKRTAVIAGIQELERGGHLTVSRLREGKKNRVNKYQLPPIGSPSNGLGSPSNALGGSPSNGPESVSSSESVKKKKKKSCSRARAREATVENGDPERLSCETCGNDWPARYGDRCHECTPSQRRRAAQRKRDRESEKAPIPEEEPETEERLGKQEERTKEPEDHPEILKTPEGPESAKEAIGDAEVSDLAWRDRLDEIETPNFTVRVLNRSATCAGDTAYTFVDGSRVLTYRKRWHHGVHKTRLKAPEVIARYEGHQLATAWVTAGYGLTEADALPMLTEQVSELVEGCLNVFAAI